MNREDLFDAIGATDEALLERSERKPGSFTKALICATAACMALIISAGVLMNILRRPVVSIDPAEEQTVKINTSIPLVHTVIPGSLDWDAERINTAKSSLSITENIQYYQGPSYQFIRSISVEARVLEVLPDLYLIPGESTGGDGFHILKLEVLDVIVGDNVPKEVFYRISENLDPDLTEYDSLILNMKQVGLENYLMINYTQQREENFTLLFGQGDYAPEFGAFLAFKDGKLDPGLWEKEGWNYQNWGPNLVSGDTTAHTDCIGYPGKLGRDIAQTKQAILDQQEYMKNKMPPVWTSVITRDYFDFSGAQEVFDYVDSLENGVFKQSYYASVHNGASLWFTRMINGFSTNERASVGISMKDGEITQSGCFYDVHFTETDMKNLPDLSSVIRNMEAYIPEKYQGDRFSEHFCGVSGRYDKQEDGTIIGTVTIDWGNSDYAESKGPSDIFVLYIAEKTVITVTQDGVITTQQQDPFGRPLET